MSLAIATQFFPVIATIAPPFIERMDMVEGGRTRKGSKSFLEDE